jgi:hypothetical protein
MGPMVYTPPAGQRGMVGKKRASAAGSQAAPGGRFSPICSARLASASWRRLMTHARWLASGNAHIVSGHSTNRVEIRFRIRWRY